MIKELIARLRHIYADGDPITEEAADCIEHLFGITEQLRQRVAELEENWRLSEIASAKRQMNVIKLTAERDKVTQYWQIAEGRCDAMMKQRDELLAALIECDEAMGYMSEYDIPLCLPERVKVAIASVKEKQNAD